METGYKITKKAIVPYGDLTYRHALQLTFVAMETFARQGIEAFRKSLDRDSSLSKDDKEKAMKEFKDSLHDEIVIYCSKLAEAISPTPQTPLAPENVKDKQEKA